MAVPKRFQNGTPRWRRGVWAWPLAAMVALAYACGKSNDEASTPPGSSGPNPAAPGTTVPAPTAPTDPQASPGSQTPSTFVTGGGIFLKNRDISGTILTTATLSGLAPGQTGLAALTPVPTDMRKTVGGDYFAFATNTGDPSTTTYDLISLSANGAAKPLIDPDPSLFPTPPASIVAGLLPNIVLFNGATGIRAFSPEPGGAALVLDAEDAPFIRPSDTPCTFGSITRLVKLQSGPLTYLLVLSKAAPGGSTGAGLYVFSGLESTLSCQQVLPQTQLPPPGSATDIPVDAVQGVGPDSNKVFVLFQNVATGGKIFSYTLSANGLLANPTLVLASPFFLGSTVARSHMVYLPGIPSRLNVHNSTRNLYASISITSSRFMGFAPGGDATALK